MNTGIYKIEHIASGKKYIGSAVNIRSRIVQHKRYLRSGNHDNSKLQNAWDKYGAEAFEIATIVVCSKDNLLMYEQLCIDGFQSVESGYNICPTAGNKLGTIHREDSKKKISESLVGNDFAKGKNLGNRFASCPMDNKRFAGKKHSEESKAKIRASCKASGNKPWLGKEFSEEHLSKLSAARVGKRLSPEHVEKIKAGVTGKTRTPEQRERIKAAQNVRRARERAEQCI